MRDQRAVVRVDGYLAEWERMGRLHVTVCSMTIVHAVVNYFTFQPE